jgi:hypothetical protein
VNPQASTAAIKEKELIIPNVHEFVIEGFRDDFPEEELSVWRDLGAGFAEPSHFWGRADIRLIIAPRPVEPLFTKYARDQQGIRELTVWSPELYSSRLCQCILEDAALIERIRDWAGDSTISLLAWGVTPNLLALTDRMRKMGIRLRLNEVVGGDSFIACRRLDSKTAFRRLMCEEEKIIPELRMPQGWIVEATDSLSKAIRLACTNGRNVFVKADLGVSGIGIHTESCGALTEMDDEVLKARLEKWIATLPYPSSGPFVVEQQASSPELFRKGTRTGSIFTNGFVDRGGRYFHFGTGVEIRSESNIYQGAIIGNWAPLKAFYPAIAIREKRLAKLAASLNYVGHLGMDFLFDRKQQPLMLEVNPRRCCESHAYDFGIRLFGNNWTSSLCALSRFPAHVQPGEWPTLADLTRVFASAGETIKHKHAAAVLFSQAYLNHINPGIGYCLFAPDMDTLRDFEANLWCLLNGIGLNQSSPISFEELNDEL